MLGGSQADAEQTLDQQGHTLNQGQTDDLPAKSFILDTDVAIDDWVAILFLLQIPGVDVRAITVSGTGECHSRPGVENVMRLAGLTARPDVPVAGGRETPLRGSRRFPLLIRWMMDRMLFLRPPAVPRRPVPQTTLELLTSAARDSGQKARMIALGGLTNIAEALLAHPTLTEKLEGIWIMGGAIDVPGNIQEIAPTSPNAVAEWNIYVDPHAANLVFHSGVPVTLVPLDATNDVPVTEDFREHLRQDCSTRAAAFVDRALARIHLLGSGRPFYLWDPMTVAVALDESLGTYEQRHLQVIEEEGQQSGQVLAHPGGEAVRVCMRIDKVRFEQTVIDGLNGRVP